MHFCVLVTKMIFQTWSLNCMFSWNSWSTQFMVWRPMKWNCELRPKQGHHFCEIMGIFFKKIPHDNLTLLSTSPGFSNVKFVQFRPGTLEVLNKGYWLLLVTLLYTYFIIFQYSMFKKKVHVIIQCLQRLEGKSESCTRWRNPNYSSQASSWFPEGRQSLETTGSRWKMLYSLAGHLGWRLLV